MAFIADALLIAGAFAAAIYCLVLSRRLRGLDKMDRGVGGAIASLNEQVSEMKTALRATQSVTGDSVSSLQSTTKKAEKIARRLEEYLSELDDLGVSHETKTSPPKQDAKTRGMAKTPAKVNGVAAKGPTGTADEKTEPLAQSQVVSQVEPEPIAIKRANRVDVRAPRASEARISQGLPTKGVRGGNTPPAHRHEPVGSEAQAAEIVPVVGSNPHQVQAQVTPHADNVSQLATRRAPKVVSEIAPPVDARENLNAAERLQDDIFRRLAGRSTGSDEDEFVRALQSVLAATPK